MRGLLGWLVAAGLVVVLVWTHAPRQQTISGAARVIDGDSLRVGTAEVRLFGIDAFEGRQECKRDGAPWRCGAAAANELRELAAGRVLTCDKRDVDSYGRDVAVCTNGSVDLGAELVRAGLALAYREFSNDYVDEEDEARSARRGAWSGEFVPPSEERRGRNGRNVEPPRVEPGPRVEPLADSTCRGTGIKGNISRNTGERIYHTPGSTSYVDTIIDESKGERWFCTEEEARRAGWRPPRGG